MRRGQVGVQQPDADDVPGDPLPLPMAEPRLDGALLAPVLMPVEYMAARKSECADTCDGA
jgi:hypothetical protein